MTQIELIKKARQILVSIIAIIATIPTFYNYFINHLYLDDRLAQWKLAMMSIATVMFLFSFRVWLGQLITRHYYNYALSGWLSLYFFANMIGTFLGYNLHTKGFIMTLLTIVMFLLAHILVKLWRNYYY